MKKIILTIGLLIAGQICFAGNCETACCREPYDLTSGFSRFFSNITGQNFIAEKIGESITKKAIQKSLTDGKIYANLNSYSTRDLKAGRFKSLEITAKDMNIDGVYISYFNAKTLCNFNYVPHDENNNYFIKEDIPASFKIEITEQDLNNTMNSEDYKRVISDINSIGGSLNLFEITSTNVKLKNGKIYYIMNYALPFVRKTKAVIVSANLDVRDGKIVFDNPNFVNTRLASDINTFSGILNYVNPLDFSAKILENKRAKFNIQNVAIEDDKVIVDGQMTILKDKE